MIMENNMLYEIPLGFSIEIASPFELDHGFFIFSAPPLVEEEFGYRKNAKPGELTDTCWGICRNGVPLELPVVDDYFGFAIIDKDDMTRVQGYYTTLLTPAYEYYAWYTRNDVIMPPRDWNLICYVGYYRIAENVLHATDWREFTIKSTAVPKPFPVWILLFSPLLLIPFLKK